MQFTPAVMGAVLLFIVMGLTSKPGFDAHAVPLKFYLFLLLALAPLLYGFGMHLYALGYPESPFNKHTSPLFMTLLCLGPLGYGAYRFYQLQIMPGLVLMTLLTIAVAAAAIGHAWFRGRT